MTMITIIIKKVSKKVVAKKEETMPKIKKSPIYKQKKLAKSNHKLYKLKESIYDNKFF